MSFYKKYLATPCAAPDVGCLVECLMGPSGCEQGPPRTAFCSQKLFF